MDIKLSKRASAEGIKVSAILAEIVKLVKEKQAESTGTWEHKELVTEDQILEVLTSSSHGLGYMYPGNYSFPCRFNAVEHSRGKPIPADVEGAKEWLHNSKDGDTVTSITDFGPGTKEETTYRKEGGRWYQTGGYSEVLYRIPFDQQIWWGRDFKEEVAKRMGCENSSTFEEIYNFVTEESMVGNVIYFP